MEKALKIEIIKKLSLLILVLISTIVLIILISAYYTGDFSVIIRSYSLISVLLITIPLAILIKYIGDIAILLSNRNRLKED
ncbi:MAG: hypothetical protein ACFFE4_09520 [Candidatus Thorarchaeota archaeon]